MKINQKLLIKNNLLRIGKKDETKVRKAILNAKGSELKDVKGLGEGTITRLADFGITKVGQLKQMREDEINKIITNPLAQRAIKNVLLSE